MMNRFIIYLTLELSDEIVKQRNFDQLNYQVASIHKIIVWANRL